MSDPLSQVPKGLRERYGEIVAHTDRFCKEHLDDEFRDLCRELAAEVCRKRLPVTSGKALSWAAGVVYELGQVNFLGDPSQKHHMTGEEMARKLGVSPATMLAKGKVIRERLGLSRMDPRWSVSAIQEHNPLVWIMQDRRTGLILDIRDAPRPVQEEAYRLGLIPFVPDKPRKGRKATDADEGDGD